MSSLELTNKAYTLTMLPLSIQTRILAYLCPDHPFRARTNRWKAPYHLPFKDPRVVISLDCGETMTVPLPNELIPPALASPVLAEAAAHFLGARVSYLTHNNTGGQLVEYVKAFAPYVRAVCTNDSLPDWYISDLDDVSRYFWRQALERQEEDSIQLLKALCIDTVKLEVLDLMDVPFLDLSDVEDDLLAGLCATLESNSATLRELALPVFRTSNICDKALEMCSLKKLSVLTVKLWPLYVVEDTKSLAPPFLRIIRAIHGCADRSRKTTTLQELRFINVYSLGYDCVTASDRGFPVFLSIKTLRVVMAPTVAQVLDETKLFILLFKNLERLFANMNPRPSDRLFGKVCEGLSEVHLCGYRWIGSSIQAGYETHFPSVNIFYGESLSDTKWAKACRSLLACTVSRMDLRNIMKHCSSLENISLHVTKENLRSIRTFVEKCRQMRCLELVFDEKAHGRLGIEDWQSLSRAIPNSHKNLCQVAIQASSREAKATACIESVFDCFEAVMKALGARARRFAFRAVFGTRRGVRIAERACGLLNTCIQHNTALESFELKLYQRGGNASDYNADWGRRVVRRLAQMENRLLHEIESLRELDLEPRSWL